MTTAKKISVSNETITPTVGMVLVPRANKPGNHKPCRVVGVGETIGIRVERASGVVTMAFGTMNKKYRRATEEEADGFNAALSHREVEDAKPALSANPSAPRPTVAHEPAVNDGPTSTPGLAKIDAAEVLSLHETIRALSERLDRAEQSRREETKALQSSNAIVAAALQKLSEQVTAPALKAGDAVDRAKKEEHKAKFRGLLRQFVGEKMEVINLSDPNQRRRALFAGDIEKAFVAWIKEGNRHPEVPYSHAVFSLLLEIETAKAREGQKIKGQEKQLTPWAWKNTRQMSLNLEERTDGLAAMADALSIIAHARDHVRKWKGLDLTPHITTVAELIKSRTFTKAELLRAMDAMNADLHGSNKVWPPEQIFTTPALRYLIGSGIGGDQ